MRDTSAVCGCCHKREAAGQCVKGRPVCPCETDDGWLTHVALRCPKCRKCPVHCPCFDRDCVCGARADSLLGHRLQCPARVKSREQHASPNALRPTGD
jgi:hypothetical protein